MYRRVNILTRTAICMCSSLGYDRSRISPDDSDSDRVPTHTHNREFAIPRGSFQNGAIAPNVIAIPLAAGVAYAWGILLSPAVGALLMSLSTVIVAINAVLLRRAKLA